MVSTLFPVFLGRGEQVALSSVMDPALRTNSTTTFSLQENNALSLSTHCAFVTLLDSIPWFTSSVSSSAH